MTGTFTSDDIVAALKAAAEPTRLRILLLLAGGRTERQGSDPDPGPKPAADQPASEASCRSGADRAVSRRQLGLFSCLRPSAVGGRLGAAPFWRDVDQAEASVRARSRTRRSLEARARGSRTELFFEQHAADWDRIRTLHVGGKRRGSCDVEGRWARGRSSLFVDLGTGTGRTLELFADRFERGLGLDVNQAMLDVRAQPI